MRWLVLAVLLTAACCGNDPGPDVTFTGAYEDWDSTLAAFMGVNAATVTQVGNPTNTATTAPNGRSTLTLPGSPEQVTYTAADYVPARFSVDPSAVIGAYEVRGITTARIATFVQTDLGVGTWDDTRALVEIEARREPSGDPADGVTVSIGSAAGFHRDGDTTAWVAGAATTGGGRYVVFPNVPVGSGTVTLSVTAPGLTCHAAGTVHLVAGEVAMTSVSCED